VAELSKILPKVKVLYSSGYAAGAVVRGGDLPPEAPFLEKPFTADALRTKVRQVLDSADAP
jgi:hypothetical protein